MNSLESTKLTYTLADASNYTSTSKPAKSKLYEEEKPEEHGTNAKGHMSVKDKAEQTYNSLVSLNTFGNAAKEMSEMRNQEFMKIAIIEKSPIDRYEQAEKRLQASNQSVTDSQQKIMDFVLSGKKGDPKNPISDTPVFACYPITNICVNRGDLTTASPVLLEQINDYNYRVCENVGNIRTRLSPDVRKPTGALIIGAVDDFSCRNLQVAIEKNRRYLSMNGQLCTKEQVERATEAKEDQTSAVAAELNRLDGTPKEKVILSCAREFIAFTCDETRTDGMGDMDCERFPQPSRAKEVYDAAKRAGETVSNRNKYIAERELAENALKEIKAKKNANQTPQE